jgi:plasmid stabilization system protein ParE
MKVRWTGQASQDLTRIRDFLLPVNPQAALRTVQGLRAAALKLEEHPHMGKRLERYSVRETRRLIVGQYEIRYEMTESVIFIIHLWHTREDR